MRYAIIFACFCALIGVAAPLIVERIIIKFPYDDHVHKEIFNDLAVLRYSGRLRELTPDIRLECAAQSHANDIMLRRSCTTIGQDGQTPRLKLEACGLNDFNEVAALVICNQEWDMGKMLDKFPDHQQILKMPEWKYIGIGVRETYYVIYLTY